MIILSSVTNLPTFMMDDVNKGIHEHTGGKVRETETETEAWTNSRKIISYQPILEAQSDHGPIFRRELFAAAYAAYHKNRSQSTRQHDLADSISFDANEFVVPDIYGVKRTIHTSSAGTLVDIDGGKFVTKRSWHYSSLQHLGTRYVYDDNDEPRFLIPFGFTTQYAAIDTTDCFAESELSALASQMKAEWEASALHHQLIAFLEKHITPAAKRIDKIICFGLGCFRIKADLRWLRRSYTQHLAAVTIRDVLARKQGGVAPLMYAQDPGYCDDGIAYLKRHLDIQVLKDPEGFRVLDSNTFVVTVSPNVPVRQIVVDLTHDAGGPAGILCDAIRNDGLDESITVTTDPESPALWAYKQKSAWIEHDDQSKEDWFGKVGVYLRGTTKDDTMEV
jgi:hypothetical protein